MRVLLPLRFLAYFAAFGAAIWYLGPLVSFSGYAVLQPVMLRLLALVVLFTWLAYRFWVRRRQELAADQLRSGQSGAKTKRPAYVYALFGVPALFLTTMWTISYFANKEYLDEVGLAVERASYELHELESLQPEELSAFEFLPLLNELRNPSLGELGTHQPLFRRFGLNQSVYTSRAFARVYDQALQQLLLSTLVLELESNLRELELESNLREEVSWPELFDSLKHYLMLYSSLHSDMQSMRTFMEDLLHKRWSRLLSAEQFELLDQHIAELFREGRDAPQPWFDIDEVLVTSVRAKLLQKPVEAFIFQRLQSPDINQGTPFSVSGALGGAASARLFAYSTGQSIDRPIAPLYTKAGYLDIWKAKSRQLLESFAEDYWVLGPESGTLGQARLDAAHDNLRTLYFQAYALEYNRLLNDLVLIPAASRPELFDQLSLLSHPATSISALARAILDEVDLRPSAPGNAVAATNMLANAAAEPSSSPTSAASRVMSDTDFERQLADEFRFLETVVDGSVDQAIADLHAAVQAMSRSDVDAPTHLVEQVKNANLNLDYLTRQMPAFPASQLSTLSSQASLLFIEDSLIARVQNAWSADIAIFCRGAINGRYPFSPGASSDVSLADFIHFFQPDGKLDSFFMEYLADVVDTSGSSWRIRPEFSEKITLSPDSLRLFQQADRIRRAYFYELSEDFGFEFGLRPNRVDHRAVRVDLQIDDQVMTYAQGPIFQQHFRWPGARPDGARISIELLPTEEKVALKEEYGSRRPVSFTESGPWAWQRLLDRAGIQPAGSSKDFFVRWAFDAVWVIYELQTQNGLDWKTELAGFRCPESL
jgi:type VI secretion system protein ImpL